MIDCQIENDHLMSLGCELMPRQAFLNELNATTSCSEDIQWGQQELNYDWPSREMGLQ